MGGQYHMIDQATGAPFDVTIPTFSLDSPHQPGRVHSEAASRTGKFARSGAVGPAKLDFPRPFQDTPQPCVLQNARTGAHAAVSMRSHSGITRPVSGRAALKALQV